MALLYHVRAKTVSVGKDGLPYWETACGLRLDGKPLGITDNKADVSCPKCKGAK